MTSDEHTNTSDANRSTEDLKDAARHEYEDARQRLSGHAERLKTQGASTIKTVVTDELDRRKAGVGAEFRSLAETLRNASKEQAEKAESGIGAAPSSLLGQGADVLESLSSELEGQSVSDLTRTVSAYARANPAIFIGGCILAGLAVGRLLTASEHKHVASSTNQSNPHRPGQYDDPRREDTQPPAYRAQQESAYTQGRARDSGIEPPVFGTPGTTMRDPSGASVADTSPEALRREDKHGL